MRAQVLALLVVAGLCGQALAITDCGASGLLERIKPTGHKLDLQIQSADHYTGGIRMNVTVAEPKDESEPKNLIIVHASDDYAITGVYYSIFHGQGRNASRVRVVDYCLDTPKELLVVKLADDLPVGSKGALLIEFEGKIKENGQGIHPHGPTEEDDSIIKVNLADSARHVFPCFDEPQLNTDTEVVVITKKFSKATSSILEIEEATDRVKPFFTTFFKSRFMSLGEVSLEIRPRPAQQ